MNIVRRELNEIVDAEHLDDRRGAAAAAAPPSARSSISSSPSCCTPIARISIAQQARTERLATFGQLIGSIGHELRNPLGVIESSLYILEQRVGGDERAKKHIGRIGEQLGVANGIISALLDMIRDRPLQREQGHPRRHARRACSARWPLPTSRRRRGRRPRCRRSTATRCRSGRCFMNLVDNAVHAAGADGRGPHPRARRRRQRRGRRRGLGPRRRPRDAPAAVRAAHHHQGQGHRPRPGAGAPHRRRATAATSPTSRAKAAARASSCACRSEARMRRYLIVDDNLAFAENLAEIIGDSGDAEAVVVESGERALELVGAHALRRAHLRHAHAGDERRRAGASHPPRRSGAARGRRHRLHRRQRAGRGARRRASWRCCPSRCRCRACSSSSRRAQRNGVVALVEDDVALADNLTEALRERGFAAVTARSVLETERLGGASVRRARRPAAARRPRRRGDAAAGGEVSRRCRWSSSPRTRMWRRPWPRRRCSTNRSTRASFSPRSSDCMAERPRHHPARRRQRRARRQPGRDPRGRGLHGPRAGSCRRRARRGRARLRRGARRPPAPRRRRHGAGPRAEERRRPTRR